VQGLEEEGRRERTVGLKSLRMHMRAPMYRAVGGAGRQVIFLFYVLMCPRNNALAGDDDTGFHSLYHRELAVAIARRMGSIEPLDSPSCKAHITLPTADAVWTASYLIVQWHLCPMDEMAAATVAVRIDGQEMMRGHPGLGRFTIHGVANGWHVLEVVATDDNGGTLDLGARMHVRFRVEWGESLLGSMARRVNAGEFGKIDDTQSIARNVAESDHNSPHEDLAPCAADTANFTLVTAAINIGRRHGDISFEDDYIGNLRHILSLRCPVVIFLQERYVHLIEPFLHERAQIRIKDISDLEAFKHAAAIDALRTSSQWPGSHKQYNPAKMKHYNALVMSKLFWLDDVAHQDPFHTKDFLWIDAGLCVRFVQPPLQVLPKPLTPKS
jgi:hypothetical protein